MRLGLQGYAEVQKRVVTLGASVELNYPNGSVHWMRTHPGPLTQSFNYRSTKEVFVTYLTAILWIDN